MLLKDGRDNVVSGTFKSPPLEKSTGVSGGVMRSKLDLLRVSVDSIGEEVAGRVRSMPLDSKTAECTAL